MKTMTKKEMEAYMKANKKKTWITINIGKLIAWGFILGCLLTVAVWIKWAILILLA